MENNVYFRYFDNRIIKGFGRDKDKKYLKLSFDETIKHRIWTTHPSVTELFSGLNRMTSVIDDDAYIICPIHQNKRLPTVGDIQFGITETRKTNETLLKGLKRTLAEEVGLRFNETVLPNYYSIRTKKKEYCVFVLDISRMTPVKHSMPAIDDLDDKEIPKIAVYAFGSRERALDFLNQDKIVRDENEDTIIGVATTKFKLLKKYFSKF